MLMYLSISHNFYWGGLCTEVASVLPTRPSWDRILDTSKRCSSLYLFQFIFVTWMLTLVVFVGVFIFWMRSSLANAEKERKTMAAENRKV